jgi:hydrophobe/amphiphile efflux-1 (HAE1) family protein
MKDEKEPMENEMDVQEVQYFFVKRPIFAMVISIVIVLLGGFSVGGLAVNTYPNITPPSVQISTQYIGATAEQVATAVAAPIEQTLPSLQGLLYYQTSTASDGSLTINCYFDIGRDQDLAAVDVQNQVEIAKPLLPQDVQRVGITVQKAQTNILLAVGFTSDDPRWDAAALSNYSRIYVQDEISRVPGVGQASTFGNLQFSMLVSTDPRKMAQLGVTVTDLVNAIQEQNTTNPAGRIGREPAPPGNQFTIPVTAQGRLTTPAEFEDIIVRALPDGSVLKVRDVATVTLGSQSYDNFSRYGVNGDTHGRSVAGMLVYLRNGANALNVKQAVMDRMGELERNFPAGVHWVLGYDTTPFITASIAEVETTLITAIILVTIVVFIFLQNWRSTLIPILAVPVSIIGTFLGLGLMGMSINLLTLFALVLAIGVVVDDAMVVIENVERIMEEEHVSAKVAADRGIRQLAGALIAIVLVLVSVFIPVAFISGVTGQLFKQFATTLVIAVVISGLVALTLTPALCSLLLTEKSEALATTGFFGWFNRRFDTFRNWYVGMMHKLVDHPLPVLGVVAIIIACIAYLSNRVPTGFLPEEDKGYFVVAVELPGGASAQRTSVALGQVEQFLLQQPEVDHVFSLTGFSLILGTNQTSSGTLFAVLKPWDQRKKKSEQLDGIVGRSNGFFFTIKDALVFAFNFPEIPGIGTSAGLEMQLQDRSVNDVRRFAQYVQQFTAEANNLKDKSGHLIGQNIRSTMRVDVPQLYVDVDRAKTKSLGIPIGDVYTTLSSMLATNYVNDFNLYGRTYRVQLEAQEKYREKPEDIGDLYVRTASGGMVPISALTHTTFRAGPTVLNRFNGFTSALVIGQPAEGKSSGDLLKAVIQLARDQFEPNGVGYAFSGQSYQETLQTGRGVALVLGLGICMAFLVLAAQYESWSTPLAVMLGVPFGILGAFLAVFLRTMPNDIYFRIGLIVVIGLEAKNAILIVEFARELRDTGLPIKEAAIRAGRERLRPILMTSFAFILGVAPLLFATGAGAGSRHSLGTGVCFGMLLETLFGVVFIPTLFVLVREVSEEGLFRRRALAPSPAVAPAPAGDD